MWNILVTLALIVLFIVPVVFIWHEVYDDGVFGRIALGGVALFSFIRLMRMVDGKAPDTPVEIELLLIAAAVFLVWHLFRFHRRVLRQRHDPKITFQQSTTYDG